jgi:hypothetical protein
MTSSVGRVYRTLAAAPCEELECASMLVTAMFVTPMVLEDGRDVGTLVVPEVVRRC